MLFPSCLERCHSKQIFRVYLTFIWNFFRAASVL